MESIQAKMLKGLYGLPKTTPYWGIVYELDVMPIMFLITYKRLMLYHNIVNSDESRTIKHLVKSQESSGHEGCWFGNLKDEARNIGMDVNEELVKGKPKSIWKKEVKGKVQQAVDEKIEEKKCESKKMRFLGEKGSDSYLQEVFNEDARWAMKIRLNMVEWIDGNFGGNGLCPLCREEEDTTEHAFVCNRLEEHNFTLKDLEEGKSMLGIVELFQKNELKRRELLKNDIHINMECLSRGGTL